MLNQGSSTLGARLEQYRTCLEFSQRGLAKKLGISLGGLQSYESGKSVPGGNVLEALARHGLNVNWLLTGEGEMMRHDEQESSDTTQIHQQVDGAGNIQAGGDVIVNVTYTFGNKTLLEIESMLVKLKAILVGGITE